MVLDLSPLFSKQRGGGGHRVLTGVPVRFCPNHDGIQPLADPAGCLRLLVPDRSKHYQDSSHIDGTYRPRSQLREGVRCKSGQHCLPCFGFFQPVSNVL